MLQISPEEPKPRLRPSQPDEEVITLLSAQQLARGFGVTLLTIRIWTSRMGLPYVRLPGDGRDSIRYRLERVKEWAKKNSKDFDARKL